MLLLLQSWGTDPVKTGSLIALCIGAVAAFIKWGRPWIDQALADRRAERQEIRNALVRAVEENKALLQGEIADARKERDEQRALRGNELAAFLAELKAQRELHEKGFAEVVSAVNRQKKTRSKGKG